MVVVVVLVAVVVVVVVVLGVVVVIVVLGDSDPLDTVAHYDIMYIVNLKNQSN